MNRNIIKVGLGALCLVGGFLPMASGGGFFVSIHHLGGLSWLLYPLALTSLGLAITALYRSDIRYMRLWLGAVTLVGLVLTALTVSTATSQLEYLANMQTSFSFLKENQEAAAKVSASIGSGGALSGVGYLCLLLLSLVPTRTASNREGGQQ